MIKILRKISETKVTLHPLKPLSPAGLPPQGRVVKFCFLLIKPLRSYLARPLYLKGTLKLQPSTEAFRDETNFKSLPCGEGFRERSFSETKVVSIFPFDKGKYPKGDGLDNSEVLK